MNVEQLGFAIIELGGGRQKLGDKLDFSTGLEMLVRLGDKVEQGPTARPPLRPARQSRQPQAKWSPMPSPFPTSQSHRRR